MALISYRIPRNARTGNSLRCTLNFEQVNQVVLGEAFINRDPVTDSNQSVSDKTNQPAQNPSLITDGNISTIGTAIKADYGESLKQPVRFLR
jgi:hypothetical protein